MKGVLAANLRPGSSFHHMAQARIAILEAAIKQLDMNNDEVASTDKQKRQREKKRNAHNDEIKDLRRQLEHGPDNAESFNQTTASTDAPEEPRARKSRTRTIKAAQPQQALNSMEPNDGSKQGNGDYIDAPRGPKGTLTSRRALPDRAPPSSPQTPRSGSWRPGHIDQQVVLPSPPNKAGRRDEIKAPSRASGGVPEPSAAYIAQASQPPRTAAEPRHILVIIDLNGALIHRPDRKKPTLYIARQSADLFLDYVFSRFQVMVWSAARPNNVDSMCKQLFPGNTRQRLLAEWGRDKMGLTTADYNARTQVYKRLETVWNDRSIQASHPLRAYGGKWDQSNTVLMDDSREKGRSHPYNLIKVPEFEGQKESEDVLRKVAEYLDDLLVQEDVSAFMHKHPFRVGEEAKGE